MSRSSILLLALVLPACAARTAIEPAGRDSLRFHAGFGGPLVSAFNTKVPIPNLAVGARYGITDDLDVDASAHLLGLLYSIAAADVGIAWYPLVSAGNGPTISIEPRLLLMASFKKGVEDRLRVWPAISGSASWHLGNDRIYGGADVTIPVSQPDYDTASSSIIISPLAGYRWQMGARSALLVELKWHGVNIRTNATAEYVNPFGYGALTPLIGYEFTW